MTGAGGKPTDREKQLLAIIRSQDRALAQIGPLLAEIGESRSRFADEAWAGFSICLGAIMASQGIVEAEEPVTLQ